MSQIPRDNLPNSYPSNVEAAHHPVAYSQTSSSADGMQPPPHPVDAAPSGKKRKPSRTKPPPELRKTASTPHIRGLNNDTSPLASPTSEKRRNKLGYHRTSVACGHCRRRKIRCLVGNDDTSGRCLNCIRLKKECHFFPVDQGPGDNKSRTTLVTEPPLKSTPLSAHSSPRNSAASDSVDDASRIQSHPSQQPFSIHSSKQSSELDYSESPIDAGSYQSPTFSYSGMPDSGGPWGQPTFFGNQNLHEEPSTPQSGSEYWTQPHPPNPAMFQHRGSIPVGLDPQAGYYAPPPVEEAAHPWAGMRSMSVGDASQLPHNMQPPYRQHVFPNAPFPYTYTQSSNPSLPLGPIDQGMASAPAASHVLPSQSLPSQSLPNDWSTFGHPDVETPVAEHHPAQFGQPWYNELSHTGQGPNSTYLPSSTHPG